MTEEIMRCYDTEVRRGEVISTPATYCMICQNIVYAAYILDSGVYHCPTCVSQKEINAITRAKSKREGRSSPESRDLIKSYSNFRGVAFSDEESKMAKIVHCKTIGCEHGTWNEDKTVWQWKEKWFCSICHWSCDDDIDVTKNKKTHVDFHKEKYDKRKYQEKVEGDTEEKVEWHFKEDRRHD